MFPALSHRRKDLPRPQRPETRARPKLPIRSSRVPINLLLGVIPIHTCTRCLRHTPMEENTKDTHIHPMVILLGDHHRARMDTEERPPGIIPIPHTVITGIRGHRSTWRVNPAMLDLPRREAGEMPFVPIIRTNITIPTKWAGRPPLGVKASARRLRRANKTSCSRCPFSRRASRFTFPTLGLRLLRAFPLRGETLVKGSVPLATPKNFRCFRFPATAAAIANTTKGAGSHQCRRYRRDQKGLADRCNEFCEGGDKTLAIIIMMIRAWVSFLPCFCFHNFIYFPFSRG